MGIDLKERIKRIIHTPSLELDGNAYFGNYYLNDWKSIKEFMLNKLRFNDKGEIILYINLDTGNKITVSGSSAGKLAGHYKYGEIYQKTIMHIPKIIENMKFLEEIIPEKGKTKFVKYSYYITGVNIDNESYTILSTVGHNENGIYYYQNVFDGTNQETFKKAKKAGTRDIIYGRLAGILENTNEDDWHLNSVGAEGMPITSTNKYSKFSEQKQD
jgi:hypothetical protein